MTSAAGEWPNFLENSITPMKAKSLVSVVITIIAIVIVVTLKKAKTNLHQMNFCQRHLARGQIMQSSIEE